MVRQINPALARLYSAELIRSYGINPPTAIAVDSPGQQRALEILEEGLPDNQFGRLPELAATTQVEVTKLLTRLGDLVTHSTGLGVELSQKDVDQRFAELMRLFLVRGSDPIAVLRQRARCELFIESMDKTGLALLRGLSNAGVRRFHTLDQQRISISDTGSMGYQEESIGSSRAQGARQLITDVDVVQHSRVSATMDRIDAAILIANDVIRPESYQLWLSRDIPHIAILFTEKGAWVSHLVRPGITPCLGCIEIAKAQTDPSWIATATQLSLMKRDFADAASLFFSVSAAIPVILSEIDGTSIESRILELDRQSMTISMLDLPTTNCGCRLASSAHDQP
ncbi:MAG: hypothetical protein RIS08_1011 [Actinomycetota bacterium]|jgi:hypothetical protein